MAGAEPPDAIARAARDVAGRVGARATELLREPAVLALVVARTRRAATVEDAVLAELHARLDDARLADEFVAFFLADLDRLGHQALGPGLRRYVDTGDLVQSVLGDLWPEFRSLRFDSRDAFTALLAARLRWKASDQARALRSGKRREDLRQNADAAPEASTAQPGPATEFVRAEDFERAALALAGLPDRERALVRGHLRGQTWSELAAEHGLQAESARKAVQRALAAVRKREGGA